MSEPTKPKRLRRYVIPLVVTGKFGCEVEVVASSKKRAIAAALKGGGTNEDGYDWDRWSETAYAIGDWQPITSEHA